jgi:hypothetical protein
MMAENWKPVVGAEGRYEVSDRGNVRSLPHTVIKSNGRRQPVKGRLLKPTIHIDHKRIKPYCWRTVWIRFDDGSKRLRTVAVLMLESFVSPRPYPKAEARHLNDQSLDDRLENLDWGSRLQNARDAVLNERLTIVNRRGTSNGSAKLTEADVLAILAEYAAGGVTRQELAEQYGVAESTISHIICGGSWQHVQRPGLTGKGELTAEAIPIRAD